jgi:hypothetical protein
MEIINCNYRKYLISNSSKSEEEFMRYMEESFVALCIGFITNKYC